MPLTPLNWLLAFSPIAMVLVLMIGLRWSGCRTGAVSWFATVVLAMLVFRADARLIAYTQVKGIMLSLDVLFIVWNALLLYYVVEDGGAIQVIGQYLPALSSDRTLQGLILGWVFASFLQGMGGFGVPVAVTAPLLVGLGFTPVQSVVMACIGHGWAVNFGSMATAFQTLLAVTNLPADVLAPDCALLLGGACIACGMVVAFLAGGLKGLLRNLGWVIFLGGLMGFVQFLLVTHGMYTLGASGAGLAGLFAAVLLLRIPIFRRKSNGETPPATLPDRRSLLLSLSAYGVLIVLAFALNIVPSINSLVDSVQFYLSFPALETGLGWRTPAGDGRAINIFGHPGAILLYASLISHWIFRAAGRSRTGSLAGIWNRVSRSAVTSSLGIIAMVGLALMMSHTGMTSLLAEGISRSVSSRLYPLAAPFVGALGAFITGSNNNSNVLFAVLQMRTAELLGLSSTMVLAAQTAGGSLGSVLAPAKVIVGCSTVGLGNNESQAMGPVLTAGVFPLVVVAVLAFLLA
jgi:lactate permease